MNELRHPRYWPTWIGIGLVRVLASAPLPVLYALGNGIGELTFRGFASRRAIAARNVERCFPELDETRRREILRSSFRIVGQSVFCTGVNWWARAERLERLVRTRDRHHYDDALAAGSNVILLAPHFIALEMGGVFLSRERAMISMYQRAKNKVVDEYVRRGRSRFGGEMVERKSPMGALVRAIRRGKPFYYLPDQDAGRRGLMVPFFGLPASTSPALGRFAEVGRALVIPCFTRQVENAGGWEIIFRAPLADYPTGDAFEDTRRMNACIESAVREMPEQYFWLHKRFKTRPPGEPDFYA